MKAGCGSGIAQHPTPKDKSLVAGLVLSRLLISRLLVVLLQTWVHGRKARIGAEAFRLAQSKQSNGTWQTNLDCHLAGVAILDGTTPARFASLLSWGW